MKRKVELSTYCIILTILTLGMLIAMMILELKIGNDFISYLAAGALVILCVLALFFTPISISVEDGCLNMNTFIRTKSIPLRDIAAIKLWPPTMAEKRICGSGGWFGYWGWFTEPTTGKYMAYYGKASDCFLVQLKNDKLYMLGCVDPLSMMECVSQQIKAND